MRQVTDAAWASYVQRFHDERAGITDAVLQGASDDESPYQWALQPVAAHGRVVDLACGSAPLDQLLAVPVCVGIDRSPAELDLAASSGAGPLVLADAGSIPLAAGVAAVVVCSMSLQILQPLGPALAEVARLLRPDGVFVALLPVSRPLSFRDRLRYARLLVALRCRGLGYPNDHALARPVSLFAEQGLEVVSDERRRFPLAVADASVGETFVRSLYLPGGTFKQTEAAAAVARRWSGQEIGIPLRRIVARRRCF